MKLHLSIITSLVLLTLSGPLLTAETAAAIEWITFQDTLPEKAKTYTVKLNYQPNQSHFHEQSRGNLKSTPIKDRKKDAYEQQLDLGKQIDGYHYIMQVKKPTSVKFLGQNNRRIRMVKVARSNDGKKFETVKEGLLEYHQDLDIPLKVSSESANVPFDKPLTGNLEINLYDNNNGETYECRVRTTLNGTLSGSVAAEEAMLHATLNSSGSLATKNRMLKLSAQPHNNKMIATSRSGKLTDTLTLGSAKVIVEKIAADNSEIVLAVLSGQLVSPKQKAEMLVEIDKPFPPFARVDLIRRELVTLDDLKSKAGPDGNIVLVFGDFKVPTPVHYGGPQFGLPLEADMIEKMLNKGCENPAVLVFFCRQLSISDLYGKWLGDAPDFYVLADYSDPAMVLFMSQQLEPHMMMQYGPNRGETLRSQLRFEPEKIVTTLIGSDGKLLYLNTNAGNELGESLMQINKLIRKGK